ncbi:MAG: iron ABC transporter permease [Erysipelotrichaceae bacterium]|nr:iron ABC transporter permease [Erysipelotrichaceae bacterium]
MFKKAQNKDFLALEGKRPGISLDNIMIIFSYIALTAVVIIPVFMIIYYTFWDGSKIDFEMFRTVLFQPENLGALKNTAIIGVVTTLLAAVIGVFFAWLLGRSDIPLKGLMKFLFSIPFMIPPFLAAMSWDMMFSGRGGYVNNMLMSLFHLANAPFNVNSLMGIIIIEVVYYFPFVYMQVVSALERMDPTLEESARIAGASQLYVITHITLPLTIPAISSGMLLVLITSLSNYGIPSLLGFSKNIFTLPTMIVELMNKAEGSFVGIRQAACLSVILVVVVAIALVIQRIVLNVGRYDIIKGKSMRPMLIKLRGAKYPLLIFSLLFLTLAVIAPLLMIVCISFIKAYGLPISLENFTLAHYQRIFAGSNVMVTSAIKNSLFLGFSAGLICLFLGTILAYVIYKVKPKGSVILEMMAVLPYSLPGTVMAIGCILAWSGKIAGINLYNTIWIILVAYIARYLSYVLKSSSAALQQVHPSLEEAARSCGASHLESLKDITLPLIKPAMLSGFFLVFLPCMRELTTSVLLYGPKSRTLGVMIYSLRVNGMIPSAAALSVLTITIIIIMNNLVNFITKDRRK